MGWCLSGLWVCSVGSICRWPRRLLPFVSGHLSKHQRLRLASAENFELIRRSLGAKALSLMMRLFETLVLAVDMRKEEQVLHGIYQTMPARHFSRGFLE